MLSAWSTAPATPVHSRPRRSRADSRRGRVLSAAQLRGTPQRRRLAVFRQTVLSGVHPPAHRGLQELDRPRRAPAPGRRGRGRAADRRRRPVPADRSAHARVGGPAHHEAAVPPARTTGGAASSSSCAKRSGHPPTGASSPTCPLARLLPRIEPRDVTLVHRQRRRGRRPTCSPRYDAVVTFLAGDLGCVERVESRMATEALGSMFEGYVAQAGPSPAGVRRHPRPARPRGARPGRAERAGAPCRMEFIADLQRLSRPAACT